MYLSCHSYYSLRYGTLSPTALVEEAAKRGISSLCLTDINNTSETYSFIQACKKWNIKAVCGIDFRAMDPNNKHQKLSYIGIAQNNLGWKELCQHLTKHSAYGDPLPDRAPAWEHCQVIYRNLPKAPEDLAPNEWIGIKPSEVHKIFTPELRAYLHKMVAYAPVNFLDEDGWKLHKLLRCIDRNIILGKLERADFAAKDEKLLTPQEIQTAFEAYPQILENTHRILDSCEIDLHSGSDNNRQHFTSSKEGDYKLLSKLAIQGCRRRYGDSNERATERVKKELQVIHRLGFSSYFLITWDIVRYGQSAGYYHIGRGSGANSIVAFCLYITDVDPLELDLYFERFINPHRSSPPDFDIDFSWSDRDDVTEYVFDRYGREHTALLATYNTFKGKSIIRELGKVFGLPKPDIDTIVEEPLAAAKHHPFAKHIFKYGKMMEGFPNYLSIHAGGVLVSEKPLNEHTALQQMPKGFPVTHFDMYGAEDLGFHKYDILSQRGLGHIKDAVDLIRKNRGQSINIHDINHIKADARVRAKLKAGECIGCFYIESPAMRGLLSKLHCEDYVHLVAASSIIRPGVAKSGMMREYIERFHKPETVKYLHPVFEQNLRETFGVMVYQEDVMKIVHHFAGLDLDESDVLRRIMTGKKKSSDTFRNLMEKYFRNCKERGYSESLTHEVWRQIESFSGYSFCKAHSASFAVESFQSLFLKTYHPLEFMVAVINNFGGFYNTELYVHEARMNGARIEAPCVNHSKHLTDIAGDTIYMGFVHLQNLESGLAHQVVQERQLRGEYVSLEDFTQRIRLGREQLNILVRIGAFRFTGRNKCELMWEKNAAHEGRNQYIAAHPFFPQQVEKFELPLLEDGKYDQAFDEMELLGFPICSPFDLLSEQITHTILARDMTSLLKKQVKMLGYYVTRKPVTTSNGKLMAFGTWIDREGKFFDTTHFPPSLEHFPFQGRACYEIKGILVEDFGFPSLEVREMRKIPYVRDERY
ncbi:MAG: DNA polymerase III subunit alpha [Bacteroidota bacterium]|nr:DNA polymerase III subunit alpha [Bacteroidota bacterium]